MDKLKLVLPKKGSVNWGNAINENFIQLLEELNNTSDRVGIIEARLEESDVINLSTEDFLYINKNGDAYKVNFSFWDTIDSSTSYDPGTSSFDPENENDLNAYIVKSQYTIEGGKISPAQYQGQSFITGDILYVVKNTARSTIDIKRWASSVGGYYLPKNCTIAADGKITTNYYKMPSMMLYGKDEVELESELVMLPTARLIHQVFSQSTNVITFDNVYYNSNYLYDVKLLYKGHNIYIGYSIFGDPNGKLIIVFDQAVPIDTICNILLFSGGSSYEPEYSNCVVLKFTPNATSDTLTLNNNNQNWYVDWGDGTHNIVTAQTAQIQNQYSSDQFGIEQTIKILGLLNIPNHFAEYTNITSFKIEQNINTTNKITVINNDAFFRCYRLNDVDLSDYITDINNRAFSFCTNLVKITIPQSINNISIGAFGCHKLIEIYNKSNLNIVPGSTDYGSVGFYAKNIYTPTSGNSKISIDKNYFVYYNDNGKNIFISYNGSETDLILPDTIEGVYQFALENNDTIKSIIIPNNAIELGDAVFSNCSSLESINLGNAITKLGWNVFERCVALKNIILPNSITYIGSSIFYGCYNLQSITTPFVGRSKLEPNASEFTVFGYFFGQQQYPNSEPVIQRGITYYLPTTLTDVTVSSGKIFNSAFTNINHLGNVILEDSVTDIETRAFDRCTGLHNITLGNGITSIGYEAFINCSALSEVTFGSNITKIQENAFYSCNLIGSIVLPNSLTHIYYGAFAQNFYTSVTIPENVIYIGAQAFNTQSMMGANFESPDNWVDDNQIAIPNLDDAYIAARHLKINYVNSTWTKQTT